MKNKKIIKNKEKKSKFKDKIKSIFISKKIRYDGLLSVFIVIFIAIVFVLNVIVSFLVKKYDVKIDLSSRGIYKVSDETKEFLNSYEKRAKLILLNDEESFKKNGNYYVTHIYNISKNIVACSDNLSLEFVNLQEQPTFAAQYKNLNLQQDGILVVDEENHSQFIPFFKMFQNQQEGFDSVNELQVLSSVERNIAHALEFLSGQNKVKTALINGHDELDLKKFKGEVFEENGYELVDLNLLTTKIPKDVKLILSISPLVDYGEKEIEVLQQFIDSGGRFIYFASSSQKKLKNLEEFILKNTGASFEDGVVVETDPNKMTLSSINEIFTYPSFDSRYVEDMFNKKKPIGLNDCKPMKLEENKNVESVVICKTQDSGAVLKDPKNFDIKSAEKKSYPIAVGVTKKLEEGKVSKIGIFSGSSILGALDVVQLSNLDFVFSVFGEIADNRTKIKIPPKVIGVSRLAITRTQANLIAVIFILILPLTVVAIGIFIYFKRRRR